MGARCGMGSTGFGSEVNLGGVFAVIVSNLLAAGLVVAIIGNESNRVLAGVKSFVSRLISAFVCSGAVHHLFR